MLIGPSKVGTSGGQLDREVESSGERSVLNGELWESQPMVVFRAMAPDEVGCADRVSSKYEGLEHLSSDRLRG